MREEIVEAWRTNNRINLFLIDEISAAGMKCTLSKRGGREVARQFAHLHDVRIYQLEKRARDLSEGLVRFQSKGAKAVVPSKAQLRKALKASGHAVERFHRGPRRGRAEEARLQEGASSRRSPTSSPTRATIAAASC